MGKSARLIPKLSATRSIVSIFSEEVLIGTLAGNKAFMNVNPGKNRTKIMPSENRRYANGTSPSGMANTAIAVTAANIMVVQYHAACFEKIYSFADAGVDGSCRVKCKRSSFSSSMIRLVVCSGGM